jgi:hypothetical protein
MPERRLADNTLISNMYVDRAPASAMVRIGNDCRVDRTGGKVCRIGKAPDSLTKTAFFGFFAGRCFILFQYSSASLIWA